MKRQFWAGFLVALALAMSSDVFSKLSRPAVAGAPQLEYPEVSYFGLQVRIDARTGCHYLLAANGLTPRLDPIGKHICTGIR